MHSFFFPPVYLYEINMIHAVCNISSHVEAQIKSYETSTMLINATNYGVYQLFSDTVCILAEKKKLCITMNFYYFIIVSIFNKKTQYFLENNYRYIVLCFRILNWVNVVDGLTYDVTTSYMLGDRYGTSETGVTGSCELYSIVEE